MTPASRVFRLLGGYGPAGGGGSAPPERRRDRIARHRSTAAVAILVSVSLHALVVLLWPAITLPRDSLLASADHLRLEAPARVVRLPAREQAPEPTSSLPAVSLDLPAVSPAEADPTPRRPDLTLAPAAPPSWTVPPGPAAPVPSTASDDGDIFVRPVALSILTNWRPEVSSDGVELTVRVHTDATGRATGLIELVPHGPDPRLNREIADRVRKLNFQPALSDGQPTAAWAEITLVICPGGVTATSPASPSGLPNPCARRVGVAAEGSGG